MHIANSRHCITILCIKSTRLPVKFIYGKEIETSTVSNSAINWVSDIKTINHISYLSRPSASNMNLFKALLFMVRNSSGHSTFYLNNSRLQRVKLGDILNGKRFNLLLTNCNLLRSHVFFNKSTFTRDLYYLTFNSLFLHCKIKPPSLIHSNIYILCHNCSVSNHRCLYIIGSNLNIKYYVIPIKVCNSALG